MDRNLQKSGVVNLLVLLGVGVAAFVVARMGQSLSGQMAAFFTGIGALVAAVSWFQMRLEDRERLEKLEFDELNRSKSSSGLFQAQDVEGFPAQRARVQFQKWAVPVFAVLLALLEGVLAYGWWRYLARPETVVMSKPPLVTLSLFG
ncbi:MAG: hypothetical protein MUC91_08580, partial [Verrucomicrobia bacterium]|nr:hypothetical protein [Verrucomicrobiota bacterium]